METPYITILLSKIIVFYGLKNAKNPVLKNINKNVFPFPIVHFNIKI